MLEKRHRRGLFSVIRTESANFAALCPTKNPLRHGVAEGERLPF